MRFLVVLVGFFAVASAVSFVDIMQEEWQTFKLSHSKDYKSEGEEQFRLKAFMENKYKIAKHNQKYAQGLVSYRLSINKYADLLHHEFVNIMNGFNRSSSQASSDLNEIRRDKGVTFVSPANVKLPKSVDWRKDGAVTPVKDQGQCGSCWAFSTTGALEGQNFRKTGVLKSLSEQNLIDCSQKNKGCNGGVMDYAFNYIKENDGIDTETSYPYQGKAGECNFKKANIGANDVGYADIPSGDETSLMEAVATIGPVSVAIDASGVDFMFYDGGVYNRLSCRSDKLDHGVLVVGYGTEEDGTDYWLVKNSWGTSWGDNGYIKMSRNKNNQCGIASTASYPLV